MQTGSSRSRASRRVAPLAILVAPLVLVPLLSACGSSTATSPDPRPTVRAYLNDWSAHDFAAMATLIDHPPPTFVAFNEGITGELGVQSRSSTIGKVRTTGTQARVSLKNHFVLAGLGPWTTRGVLDLVQSGQRWKVAWTPRSIDDALGPGAHFVTKLTWPPRAQILGAAGAPLSEPTVSVGIEGSRVTDPGQLRTALETAGATDDQISAALSQATAHPSLFVPVLSLSQDRYEQLKPVIYPVPGTVFQTAGAEQGITADLSAHIVGTVGPATAEELRTLGAPYTAGDDVGQSGLEQADEGRLAGRPGGTIQVVNAKGAVVSTVARFSAQPAPPLETTIDPTVEGAAEQALNGVAQPAALVALQASTGNVLAAVSRPLSSALDIALVGQYPPGSTFKVVTAADLLEHGLSPTSPASCPPTITAGGVTFHNFEGETQAQLSLTQAFAESCNAAFIGLAASLPYPSFAQTAHQFGIGSRPSFGLDAFGGSVPDPTSDAERAATAIGQAKVVVSPLVMAGAAAAVDNGALHEPRLVVGAPDDTAAPVPLPAQVVSGLQTMMTAVVASGTAAGEELPPGTAGKTGTAEFGSDNPPSTHAWFIGYKGDVAFAVLVVGGGIGGTVAAPIAARFLNALGPNA
jgi:cell division protein FtsI/penicillin-binding protein 2